MSKTVSFIHTQFNTDVTLYADMVFAVVYMPTMKSTAIISTGGAAVPVTDTQEEAIRKISAAKLKRKTAQTNNNNRRLKK